MQIPSAEFIEAAYAQMNSLPSEQIKKQADEFWEAGGSIIAKSNCYNLGLQTNCYNLGLQTARVILATHPLLIKAGINPDDLL